MVCLSGQLALVFIVLCRQVDVGRPGWILTELGFAAGSVL
jgi:hypothetical protein